jgi:hypothetical protein
VTGPSYKISSRFRVIVWSWCKVLGCLWFPHECATGLAASVVEIYPKSCTNVDVSLPVFLEPLDRKMTCLRMNFSGLTPGQS